MLLLVTEQKKNLSLTAMKTTLTEDLFLESKTSVFLHHNFFTLIDVNNAIVEKIESVVDHS